MRKKLSVISIIIASAAGLFLFASIAGFMIFAFMTRGIHAFSQPDKVGCEDGWTYYYSENKDWCIAVTWEWDGDPDHMTVTVPEELGGRTVIKLSTNDWAIGPFCVTMPESLQVPNDDDMAFEGFGEVDSEDTDYKTYHFTFVLNPNIKEVYCKDSYTGRILDEETGEEDVIYSLEYTFTMDGESDYLDIVAGQPVSK